MKKLCRENNLRRHVSLEEAEVVGESVEKEDGGSVSLPEKMRRRRANETM